MYRRQDISKAEQLCLKIGKNDLISEKEFVAKIIAAKEAKQNQRLS